jgi:hypothetical protein
MSAPFHWWTLAIPYRRFTISSPLDPATARQRLARAVGPHSWSGFEGELVGKEFTLRRIINYRNSFLPEVSGELMPSGAGTVISGRIVLHLDNRVSCCMAVRRQNCIAGAIAKY